jgi:hypothetical protein
MKYIYIKLLHSIIFTSAILVALYLNQMYFAIGFAIFAVLLYPFKSILNQTIMMNSIKRTLLILMQF